MQFVSSLSLRIKILIAVTVLLIAGGVGYARYKSTAATQPQYQTTQAEKGTLVVSVSASGQVASGNSASVTSQASGVVTDVFVSDGQTVSAGTAIAKLELDEASRLAYTQALASHQSAANALASARNTLNTLQSALFAANQRFINDAVARDLSVDDPTYIQQNADWLAAENNYKNQENVIKAATLSLSSAALSLRQVAPTIYAPIAGVVSGLSLQPGSVLTTSGEAATKIANLTTAGKPSVSVSLTEADVIKIKPRNKVTITLDAYSDKTYTGTVVSVDTVGVVSSGVTSYPVVIVFETPSPEILANMAASISIITNTKANVLLIPASAVHTQNGETSVDVLREGQPETVLIEVGMSSDTQTEVVSGLAEGDTVVTATTTATSPAAATTSPFGAAGGNRGFGTGGGAGIIQGGPAGGR